ncbi:MAG: sigma-70 family RNA polymerase sigma factor [Myxococcales bacterium]|nr:sigma-70 family RNA polymerase sigma factor [Myxococcales bacterium]MCB9736803.1 sigma-70 family RNA polymerase sigma factor [Deltaproteobacteria bacterium]
MAEVKSVTALLRDWRSGDRRALDDLIPLVYDELHRLAAARLVNERAGHTWRPTDLVSEAYLRLSRGAPPDDANRAHFFAIAARTMRQLLVDRARRRDASKRGGGERPVTLHDEVVAAGERPDTLVALDAAIEALSGFDERKARVVELHYFGGLKQAEIAIVLGVHVNTVARELRLAEAWLYRQLSATP